MIINTGLRTDIPAFYSKWFYNRIKEGYVLSRNPYNPLQVTKYRLSPSVVDCLAFCTKNPAPMLSRLSELDAFHQLWFVTITPYGKDIEPLVPEKERVIEVFQKLSERIGVQAMSWRYDPIFLNDKYTVDYHLKVFEEMARKMNGFTDSCIISYIDLYAKTKRNFQGVAEVPMAERESLGREFAAIGRKYGIRIYACCEGTYLEKYGVDCAGCMTQRKFEQAIGCSLTVPKSKKAARKECNCLLGDDIGMYNTCLHGCLYCYANYDMESVKKNQLKHNPNSPFLVGELREEDVVREAKQETYVDGQISLFDGGNLFL